MLLEQHVRPSDPQIDIHPAVPVDDDQQRAPLTPSSSRSPAYCRIASDQVVDARGHRDALDMYIGSLRRRPASQDARPSIMPSILRDPRRSGLFAAAGIDDVSVPSPRSRSCGSGAPSSPQGQPASPAPDGAVRADERNPVRHRCPAARTRHHLVPAPSARSSRSSSRTGNETGAVVGLAVGFGPTVGPGDPGVTGDIDGDGVPDASGTVTGVGVAPLGGRPATPSSLPRRRERTITTNTTATETARPVAATLESRLMRTRRESVGAGGGVFMAERRQGARLWRRRGCRLADTAGRTFDGVHHRRRAMASGARAARLRCVGIQPAAVTVEYFRCVPLSLIGLLVAIIAAGCGIASSTSEPWSVSQPPARRATD